MKKSPFRLREIKIEVTHDCMLQCVHCSSMSAANTSRNMGWQSCEQIINEAVSLGAKEFAFSGGEPLLWKHIEEAIYYTSKFGVETFLYTSGNAPNAQKRLNRLFSAGLQNVIFSIFGANDHQHEKVTERKGSYSKTLSTVDYCQRIGMSVEFHIVPLIHNYKSLPEIAKLAKEYDAKRLSLLRLVPQGRGAEGKDGQLSLSQNLELRKIVQNLRNEGHNIRLGSPYNFLRLQKYKKCNAGIDHLTVGPDLGISPCDAFKHISPEDIGVSSDFSNLREHSLQECWEKSPYLWAVRNNSITSIAIECKTCREFESCGSGCIAQKFYRFDELRKCPDPMCLLQRPTGIQ